MNTMTTENNNYKKKKRLEFNKLGSSNIDFEL